jgi:hypothetical protein
MVQVMRTLSPIHMMLMPIPFKMRKAIGMGVPTAIKNAAVARDVAVRNLVRKPLPIRIPNVRTGQINLNDQTNPSGQNDLNGQNDQIESAVRERQVHKEIRGSAQNIPRPTGKVPGRGKRLKAKCKGGLTGLSMLHLIWVQTIVAFWWRSLMALPSGSSILSPVLCAWVRACHKQVA